MDNVVLGLVFFLSLVFLAIIFGERLSLSGFVDGRWLTSPLDLITWFWDMVCEAADRVWCFVFDHFWWVAATTSGGIGLLLVAIMMLTGLSENAEADKRDEQLLMSVGSVLDHTPVVAANQVMQVKATGVRQELDHLVYQVPSRTNRFHIPEDIRRVITDFGAKPPVPPAADVPSLEIESPTYIREPDYSRSRLSITLQPFVERQGRRIRSARTGELIQNALFSLRNDHWQTYSNAAAGRRSTGSQSLRENSLADVDDLTARVRVIPGDTFSENDLLVEKSVPTDAGYGEFEIQIQVTNQSRSALDGLIVRELMPATWKPVELQPRGVYRDSTVTWLLNQMQPGQRELLTLRVVSTEAGSFPSYTEVSATAAVGTSARISSPMRQPLPALPDRSTFPDLSTLPNRSTFPDRSTLPSRPTDSLPPILPERSLPPVEKLPDVRLTLLEPPRTVNVGEDVDVLFQVRNVGDAPATGVSLRVQIPFGLDHHDLQQDDLRRTVDSIIRRLEPNERRQVRLTVQPTTGGSHFASAELRLQESQLDLREFEIIARETKEERPLIPRPDFR